MVKCEKEPIDQCFAVNSHSTMFLYAEDYSRVEKSGTNIAKLLLKTIDEMETSNVL